MSGHSPSELRAWDGLSIACVVFLWGFNIVAAKVAVTDIPPLTLTFLRFALVAAMLAPFFRPERHHLPWILLLSVTFGTIHFGALFIAVEDLDAATVAMLLPLGVPFTVLFAALFLKEVIGPIRWAGIGLSLTGTAVLAGDPSMPGLVPFLLMMLATSCWALSNIIVKKLKGVHPLAMTGWLCLFATPQVAPFMLWFEWDDVHRLEHVTAMGWAAFIYTAIAASIIAHSVWYSLLSRHPISRIGPFALLAPVIGAICGVLVLNDVVSMSKAVGGLITFSGVCVVEYGARRMAKAQREAIAAERSAATTGPQAKPEIP